MSLCNTSGQRVYACATVLTFVDRERYGVFSDEQDQAYFEHLVLACSFKTRSELEKEEAGAWFIPILPDWLTGDEVLACNVRGLSMLVQWLVFAKGFALRGSQEYSQLRWPLIRIKFDTPATFVDRCTGKTVTTSVDEVMLLARKDKTNDYNQIGTTGKVSRRPVKQFNERHDHNTFNSAKLLRQLQWHTDLTCRCECKGRLVTFDKKGKWHQRDAVGCQCDFKVHPPCLLPCSDLSMYLSI